LCHEGNLSFCCGRGDILYSRRSSIVSVSSYAMRETSPSVVAEEIFYTLGEVV
jgi:hypothetical protein